MIGKDWLTSALKKDLEVYYLKAEDLIFCNINKSCCRNIDTCRDNYKIVFPVSRVFASWEQLEQDVQHFSKR